VAEGLNGLVRAQFVAVSDVEVARPPERRESESDAGGHGPEVYQRVANSETRPSALSVTHTVSVARSTATRHGKNPTAWEPAARPFLTIVLVEWFRSAV